MRVGKLLYIAQMTPFFSDRTAIFDLVDQCTKLQLSLEPLLDVVQSFLTQQRPTISAFRFL